MPQRWRIALIAALLFLLGSAGAHQRISVIPDRIPVENCLFGADTQEFRTGMAAGAFNVVGKQKHFLARYYFAAMVRGQEAVGIPARQGWLIAAALPGGAFGATAFLLLIALGVSMRAALPGTLLLASSNAVFIHFAIPETYLLTGAVVLIALLTFVMVDRSRLSPWQRTAIATVAASIAALAHLPAAAVLLVHGALEIARARRPGLVPGPLAKWAGVQHDPAIRPGRRSAHPTQFTLAAAISLFIGLAPSLFLSGTGWASDYVRDYASLAGFTDSAVLGDYLATIGLFSLIAPFDACSCRYVAADALRLFADPVRAVLTVALVAGFCAAIVRLWRELHRAFLLGLFGWFGVTALFYLWFFPYEAMLPGLLFAIPLGLTLILGLVQWRFGWVAIFALALGLAAANDPLRWSPVERFGQCCPPERWSPWPLPPEQWLPPEQL
jgi:hypothetical protein